MKQISSSEFEKLIIEKSVLELIDVREQNEWDMIRIPWAKLIPLSSLQFRIWDIDFSKPVYVFCKTWGRSGKVCTWLEWEWKEATNVAWSIKELYLNNSKILEITEKFDPNYFS